MSDTTPISLVEIVRNDATGTFIVQSAGLDRSMPQIEANTIPACLDEITKVFDAAHNGETEYDGTSIVWIRNGGDMTVKDPNGSTFDYIAPQPSVMGQAA